MLHLLIPKSYGCKSYCCRGRYCTGGRVFAEVQETNSILHKSMIPPNIEGRIVKVVPSGKYTVLDTIVEVESLDGTIHEIKLAQKWPIRIARPTAHNILHLNH